MPYLMLQTNVEISRDGADIVLKNLSAAVARALGKPESYVMIALDSGKPMLFAGSAEPTAYMELKSLGLPEAATPALSQTLCGLIEQQLEISQERIYIEFSNPANHLWGWNGETFQ